MSLGLVSYGTRHVQALLASLGRLARNPFATLLTLLVIALALVVPLGLELFVTNARIATGGFANAVDLSVYLKTDVALAKAEQLAKSARARPGIARVELISADAALAEFRAYSGFGAALGVLSANPLPHVLHVHPTADAESAESLEALRRYFVAWPEVDVVQIDAQWVMRFNAILEVLRRLLIIAAAILGAGVIAVIGNTIRLEILNRRGEIEVTKIVGGSNSFVRRPFLYAGILYGGGGALLAWAIAAGAITVLAPPVATLARSYGSHYALVGPTAQELLILIASGVILGWLGAWLSATKHLRSIEPRA
ncbi:MAG TPA: permease-like cell division protein FtsX [Steroidobacteraceae bacterium]|jgi:cell division transport system permease protein|nr:permease-like cell division protein FtsX [Steroidobacteraceae bacterium]